MTSVGSSPSIHDLVAAIEPDLDVLSLSAPEPILREFNAVGIFETRDAARNAVLAVEHLDPNDGDVGMATLGSIEHHDAMVASGTDDAGVALGADPEGVVGDIVPRSAKGAVMFGFAAAAITSVVIVMFGDPDPVVVAVGATSAALFGAVIGAMWGAFARMGLSDAYADSFVAPDSFDRILVSYHTDVRSEADEAARRFGIEGVEKAIIVRLDEITDRTPGPPRER
jgi:hypothetical protein